MSEQDDTFQPSDDDSGEPSFASVWDPYFFEPLYTAVRQILQFIGTCPDDTVEGKSLLQFTKDFDTLRIIVSWGFLAPIHEAELSEYDPPLNISDWAISYRITDLARDFSKLEMNNISELNRCILILLRADFSSENRMGFYTVSTRIVGFYELVMILNKSEHAVLKALNTLQDMGFVTLKLVLTENCRVYSTLSEITITNKGLIFLEKGGARMSFNNINIVNSNVGVVSLQSTLTNIDTSVGNIKQKGHTDFANALAQLTEKITESTLLNVEKQDVLEQLEVIMEQAEKEPNDRKLSTVKGALAFLEKTLTSAAALSTVWTTCGRAIRNFFVI